MSISLTTATKRLRIGKRKLYQMLKSEGITPTLKSGHKLISKQNLRRVEDVLKQSNDTAENAPDTAAETCQHRTESGHDTAEDASDTGGSTSKNDSPTLLARMDSEIEHLRQLLTEEKEERKAERQERENYQKIVMVLQQDNQHLRQQLLEVPKHSTFDAAVDYAAQDIQDSVDISTPTPAPSAAKPMEYAPRSSSWGLGVGLGAVSAAAMLYMVVASEHGSNWFPSLQDKVRGALQLTYAGSIVPYRYEDGGLR